MTKRKGATNGFVTKDEFRGEVEGWAEQIGVTPKEIHIRPMTRKWGSCSTTGRVSFDTNLMYEGEDFRKEVIVHELLHLKVPNHGRVFRSLLRAYLGDAALSSVIKKKSTTNVKTRNNGKSAGASES